MISDHIFNLLENIMTVLNGTKKIPFEKGRKSNPSKISIQVLQL